MKTARKIIKALFLVLFAFNILIFSAIIYLNETVSDDFKIKKGGDFEIEAPLPVTAVFNGTELSQSGFLTRVGDAFKVDLKMFGIIPFSTVNVSVVDELHVALLGQPFGMKLYTEGVLVVDLTEVSTEKGAENPAEQAGIKKGDYILSVDGENVYTNEDLSAIVERAKGKLLDFIIKRDGKKMHIKLSPIYSSETDSYKIGIWVRDSSAGIGTLTYYSPATDIICGLGHGICDEDTGTLMELNSGEILKAEIISVEKGSTGAPGQLNGRFKSKPLGKIALNCECGVYSFLEGDVDISRLVEIAFKQEIKEGKAQILCTVNGDTPQLFDCEIKLRTSAFHSQTQNMIITVTDKRLLELTGGIVQGMSGSPLLQNGKLIGAVTHVLVDDPTKGYAIFAENMLETAQGVAEEKFRDAS